MEWVDRILLLLALVSFIAGAIEVRRAGINFTALGLAFWVLVSLLHALGVER